jgi:hypothetical protein
MIEIITVETIRQQNVERLNTLKEYLVKEETLKKPNERYISDLKLSIESLDNDQRAKMG